MSARQPPPRERNEADGLSLNAHTATPGWLGERLNVGWAIDVLHPLARAHPGGVTANGRKYPYYPGATRVHCDTSSVTAGSL